MQSIAENVRSVKENIASICKRTGRNPNEITIVAVTKTFPKEIILEVLQTNLFDIGENFVQELREKKEQIHDERIRWHFIGHLQRNKVKYIAPWISVIHSVDSVELAVEINKRAEQSSRTIEVFLEVHTTNEDTKHGIKPEETILIAKEMQKFSNIHLNGLMTMGPLSDNAEDARPSFKMLRKLKTDLYYNGIDAPQLSMGMSGDYEIAIEEGATMIRLGTALFGERKYSSL
ncbi:MAG: YggS family pyridoxal phosphate-dependent enzyme [Ignavibacteria bacterium]|nr:YggS family pyridoxal phosphate-dependent enzyme [Ignavibacteria bacterium]